MKAKLFLCTLLIISAYSFRVINDPPEKTLNYGSPKVEQELVADDMFRITIHSQDSTYGYTQENPIMVGGGTIGPLNERRFLNALTSPDGDIILYKRLGSCCKFYTENSLFDSDSGFLDKYEVKYRGLEEPVILYLNMYDSDTLRVPVGFKLVYEMDLE